MNAPTRMDQFTDADWRRVEAKAAGGGFTADSVLNLLRSLALLVEGFPVDQLTHACQTATRAERAGANDEVVIAALCHDIGKAISDANHGAISAEILRSYVSDDTYQVVRTHQDFQLRHYAHYFGGDPEARERHRGAPWFTLAAQLTDEWDQTSFDPEYDTLRLEHFEPVVRRVFGAT
ncbi:MAG: HD domain-containing protein [Actinomycetota bacterium]|nr:HD domain-containing protein [Actinomycetota bacterium]